MKTQKRIFIALFPFLFNNLFSQDFQVTRPEMKFAENQLSIVFDIINKNPEEQFYVWVKMEKKNGEPVTARSFSGDIGENVKAGTGRRITWDPGKDSVFLNEEILVEVMAEKYIKSFNRGSVVLMSVILPGMGQTKIKNGKPWWMAGSASYGIIAGGLIMRNSGLGVYDDYLNDRVAASRAKLLEQAQQKIKLSNTLLISGAAIWTTNILWVASAPNRSKPPKSLSLNTERMLIPNAADATLLTLKVKF